MSAARRVGAVATGGGAGWYWCVRHDRVEQAGGACRADDRMGPYPTEEAARNWQGTVEARNAEWDAEERAWSGDEA